MDASRVGGGRERFFSVVAASRPHSLRVRLHMWAEHWAKLRHRKRFLSPPARPMSEGDDLERHSRTKQGGKKEN